MTNFDTGLEYDDLEADIAGTTRIGFGFDFASPATRIWGRDVAAASSSFDADYVERGNRDSYWAFGWEVDVLQLIQARAGYQWFDDEDNRYDYDYYIVTLGGGVGWEFGRWIVHADYAHVSEPSFFGVDRDRDMFGATVGARF